MSTEPENMTPAEVRSTTAQLLNSTLGGPERPELYVGIPALARDFAAIRAGLHYALQVWTDGVRPIVELLRSIGGVA